MCEIQQHCNLLLGAAQDDDEDQTKKKKSFLLPQRIEDLNRFLSIISEKTGLNIDEISYISPLWTYKLLTLISLLMIIGEIIAFLN